MFTWFAEYSSLLLLSFSIVCCSEIGTTPIICSETPDVVTNSRLKVAMELWEEFFHKMCDSYSVPMNCNLSIYGLRNNDDSQRHNDVLSIHDTENWCRILCIN